MITLYQQYIAYLNEKKDELLSQEFIFDIPYKLLRKRYKDHELRTDGVFFSSQQIAKTLLKELGSIDYSGNVLDPCCGAGDLLLAYAQNIPLQENLEITLSLWRTLLHGCDINKDLLSVAKLRIALLAFSIFHPKRKINEALAAVEEYDFPNLICQDAMMLKIPDVNVILLNPPYQQIISNERYDWGHGRISLAAIFIYFFASNYPEAKIAAILPDVLRSGSRYEKFRQRLEQFNWAAGNIYGRFDSSTDVDVFTISNCNISKVFPQCHFVGYEKISDYFNVHVGPVVPHRDAKDGQEHLFLSTKNVPANQEITNVLNSLKSSKKTYMGPFVVLRRTSSPSDKIRCSSTIINSGESFLVENHLLLVIPKNGSIESCRRVHKFFNSVNCNNIVNSKIRCRHLTTSVVLNLPYTEEK